MAALILTLRRIGWTVESPRRFRDDRGVAWDCLEDSPAAIRDAVRASVRRWRFGRICSANPGLAAETSDGPLSTGLGTPTTLVHVDSFFFK